KRAFSEIRLTHVRAHERSRGILKAFMSWKNVREVVGEIFSSIYYGPSSLSEDHNLRGASIVIPRIDSRIESCLVKDLFVGVIFGHLLRTFQQLPRVSARVSVADFSRKYSLDLARFATRRM
ncbi:hypothetical protein A2U01_0058683, partial [Trifolium medium]|nr:hypothetical protein [Trifolium medium]